MYKNMKGKIQGWNLTIFSFKKSHKIFLFMSKISKLAKLFILIIMWVNRLEVLNV